MQVDVKFVLFLTCPVEVCLSRCLNRGQGRADDNEDSLRQRVNVYNTQTFPIIEHYKGLGLVREVASDVEPEKVSLIREILFELDNAGFLAGVREDRRGLQGGRLLGDLGPLNVDASRLIAHFPASSLG